jgi:hypothetical protein
MVRIILLALAAAAAAPASAAAPTREVVAVHPSAAVSAAAYVVSAGIEGQQIVDQPAPDDSAPARPEAASSWEQRMVQRCVRIGTRIIC